MKSLDLLRSLYSIAAVVEARDPYTGGHCWRVAQLSELVAIEMNLDERTRLRIGLAGFLHDLGKVGVPDAILNKTGKLTDDEYEVIKTHPSIAAEVLKHHPLGDLAINGALAHHERPDGKGYPNGLSEAQIHLDASIISVTDAFDAMTSHRPYRNGMGVDKAIEILQENSGSQFNSNVVKHFCSIDRHDIDAIVLHSDHHTPLQVCPNCGPVVVVYKEMEQGDKTCCRNCGGEFSLFIEQGVRSLKPTGGAATPEQLQPTADHELISRLANRALPLLKTDVTWWQKLVGTAGSSS